MSPTLQAVHPVLAVRDVPRSIQFYERLGFRCAFTDNIPAPKYAAIQRDHVELHLQWHDESAWAHPGDRPNYRFVIDDVDALFAEYRSRGVLDEHKHTTVRETPWGTREFHLHDPDHNGLQFYMDA